MFTLSFSKILLTILVVVTLWRGLRFLRQIQARAGRPGPRRSAARPNQRVEATDLVECPRCGLFVPNGTICRSTQECQYRRA